MSSSSKQDRTGGSSSSEQETAGTSSSSEKETLALDYLKSLRIPFKLLKSATDNFAEQNLFHTDKTTSCSDLIYKGRLEHSDGQFTNILARKSKDDDSEDDTKEGTTSRILKHKNIASVFKMAWNDDDDDDDDDSDADGGCDGDLGYDSGDVDGDGDSDNGGSYGDGGRDADVDDVDFDLDIEDSDSDSDDDDDDDVENGIFVIYKHESNGSLDKHLTGSTLTWIKRLHICAGVARALSYIHNFNVVNEDVIPDGHCVLHGNIKSSRILLDVNWEPKLSNFRSAMFIKPNHLHICKSYKGTPQYMDPAYEKTGGLTTKSDVFSFGIVLFEVLFGREASSFPNEDTSYFARLARLHYEKKTLDDMINPDLRKQMDMKSFDIFSEAAYCCLKEQRQERPHIDQIVKALNKALELQNKHESHELVKGTSSTQLKGKRFEDLKIQLSDILLATDNFAPTYEIGSGGYGMVYRAKLDHCVYRNFSSMDENDIGEGISKRRNTVAIKRIFSRGDALGEQGFISEVELLSRCEHPNIISLLGFCDEGSERILIYEDASNGSLDDYLGNSYKVTNLSWGRRLQICLDVAHGLSYLHTSSENKPRIIHRDLKSANILLDNDWKAKIADFGLSRLHPTNQARSTLNTITIAGTKVYLDPEYMKTGKLKKESDIYSFGIVLFELLFGRLAYDEMYYNNDENGFSSMARRLFNDGELNVKIDPKLIEANDGIYMLNGTANQHSFDIFSNIAIRCLAETQSERPPMEVIIKELEEALHYQENNKVNFQLSFQEIKLATKNFSDEKCIGEGKYWKQYEGEIPYNANANGCTTVIAKRFDSKCSQGHDQYIRELRILLENKHKNIVALVGYCNENDEKIIFYEHGFKGSLDKHLNNATLTWMRRLKICIDVASGLKFLHGGGELEGTPMIHKDFKSSSILLNGDWKAHISNLELCSYELGDEEIEHLINGSAYGSLGYIDPECKSVHSFSSYTDIYSLGVILLEMLCGRLALGEGCEDRSQSLRHLANKLYHEKGNLDELVFEGIKEEIHPKSLIAFVDITLQCIKDFEYGRPYAIEVLTKLNMALDLQEKWVNVSRISLEEIRVGTHNFSDDRCIAEGRYWKQYKGEISHNPHANGLTTIVAKRFDNKYPQGKKHFFAELEVLCGYKHENIIGFAGCCNVPGEKIIVYEHLNNESLDKHLDDASLTWIKRLKIGIDVASALKFLQNGDVTKEDVMIHRDLKSCSILLNGDWMAKISNLELSSKEKEMEKLEHVTDDNAYGSLGYADPDRAHGYLTHKSDIYSLGVILIEMLCGRLAWGDGCENYSASLASLAKRYYVEKVDLKELVFEGIRKEIDPQSLATYCYIAFECLHEKGDFRKDASEVVLELKKALEFQEDHDLWEHKLPKDYEKVFDSSKTESVGMYSRKGIYDLFCKGILLQEGKVLFSLGSNGERSEMISAKRFSFKNSGLRRWQSIAESRFEKVVEMLTVSKLNIKINITTQFLSVGVGVNYGVYLVFKFCRPRKPSSKSVYVNLTYKMGSEVFHAYFATWRNEEWMTIELHRFLNHKENTNFVVLLESFSQCYCGRYGIYVEGIEFRAIDNASLVNNKEIADIEDVQQIYQSNTNMGQVRQLPFNSQEIYKTSENGDEGEKVLSLNEANGKKHHMFSAKEVLYDFSVVKPFHLKPSAESRFKEVIELSRKQIFGIKCKIESNLLLPETNYICYLVFKLSEKCHGLHCPVKVRDVLHWKNKEKGILYFRPPSPWNVHANNQVPEKREDGWMEVMVWKFNSSSELRNDCIPINLKLIAYEGTMSGLIVCGLEIRPM